MRTINDIPVYECVIDDNHCGIVRVSLVDFPAVDVDFQALAKAQPVRLSIASEERRLVRGVVCRADFPIYRNDEGGEYYLLYTAPAIREIAERFLRDNRQNYVNLMHATGDIEGIHLVQLYIKDSAAGVSPEGFDDVADGSLFAEYRVERDDVWQAVKDGTFRGFSLEGYFGLVPSDSDEKKQTNKKQKMKMNLFKKAMAALSRVMLGALTTDGGILYWDGEGDIAEGLAVEVETEEGDRIPAPDGVYTAEDGTVVTVEGGLVVSVVKPGEEPAGEPAAEPEAEDEEPAQEPEPAAEPEEEPAATVEERLAALEEAVAKILAALERQGVELKAQRQALKAVQAQPVAKPAHQSFKAATASKGLWGSEMLDFSNLKK